MKNIYIKKETVEINRRQVIRYFIDDIEFNTLSELLKEKYKNHGEFYKEVFGVNERDAKDANWGPEHSDFNSECVGWKEFLYDGGVIKKTMKMESVTLRDEMTKDYHWGIDINTNNQ